MTDQGNDFVAKFTVSALTEVFKQTINGFFKVAKLAEKKNKEYDIFGLAAQTYVNNLEERYKLYPYIRPE